MQEALLHKLAHSVQVLAVQTTLHCNQRHDTHSSSEHKQMETSQIEACNCGRCVERMAFQFNMAFGGSSLKRGHPGQSP